MSNPQIKIRYICHSQNYFFESVFIQHIITHFQTSTQDFVCVFEYIVFPELLRCRLQKGSCSEKSQKLLSRKIGK